jgi:hypothetical protein
MYSVNDIIMAENRNYQVYEVITAPDLSTWDHNDIFYWNSYECIKWVGV